MFRTWPRYSLSPSALALCRKDSQGIPCTHFLHQINPSRRVRRAKRLRTAIQSLHGYRKVEILPMHIKGDLRQYLD
jgi:hypothetical protein